MFDLNRYKDNIAVISDRNEVLSYGQLADEVEKFANNYRGGLIFTLCVNRLGSLVGYVACMNKHIPQVLLDGSKDLELVQKLIGVYKPEYLWLPTERVSEMQSVLSSRDVKVIYQAYSYSLVTTGFETEEMNSELLLCLTTSGSTGSPKLVRLSERNLESNAESIAKYLNITSCERPVTTLPMYYSYGMSVINSHLII